MRRPHVLLPFILALAPARFSSPSHAIKIDWGTVHVVMTADSARGTLIWSASRHERNPQSFVAYFEPAEVHSWTQQLREFLALSLVNADTGSIRASSVLRSTSGDAIYFVRLKFEGRWTDERLIVMEGSRQQGPRLLVEGTERNAIEFLEALESTNMKALGMPRSDVVDSIPILNPVDTSVCPIVQKNPPAIRYPATERRKGRDGEVWLSYVVSATGAVDPTSFESVLSDGKAFESSVRDALVRTRFTPANRNGTPIAVRVFQQFTFRLVHCNGSDLASTRAAMMVGVNCGR